MTLTRADVPARDDAPSARLALECGGNHDAWARGAISAGLGL